MKRKTDRGRMKFRAFMVCVLLFWSLQAVSVFKPGTGKGREIKAVYAAESTVSRVKIPVEPVSGGVRTGEKYHRVRI